MIEVREGFPHWAWPLAYGWAEKCRAQLADDFFPRSQDEFVESYSVRFAGARTFGLWKDDLLGGVIIIEPASPVVATAHILLANRLWGTPPAELLLVAALMFDSQPELIRIQAFVPSWNRLAIAFTKRLGAIAEGTLRSATMRGGKPADAVVFGLTRDDFYGVKRGTEPGRIGGRDDQQRVVEQRPEQHVFGTADRGPDSNGIDPLAGSRGIERGNSDAGNDGRGNDGGEPDQLDVKRPVGPGESVPRAARVRTKRTNGAGGPGGGARARKPARK